MNLAARIALLSLVAAAPLAGLQAHALWGLSHRRDAELAAQAGQLAALVAADQQAMVEGLRQVLGTIAAMPGVRSGDAAQCQRVLLAAAGHYPAHVTVSVAGRDGRVLCSTDVRARAVEVGDRPYFRDAMASAAFTVGATVGRRSDGQQALPLALPYLDERGEPAGVVLATLLVPWLETYLTDKPLPPGTALVVADHEGTALHAAPGPAGAGQPLPPAYAGLLAAKSPGTARVVDADGRGWAVGYVPPPGLRGGLFVAVGMDRGAALEAVTDAQRRGLAGLAAFAAASLLAAWWLGRHLVSRPLARLRAAAAAMGGGDLGARVGAAHGLPELREAAAAFDAMAAALEAGARERGAAEARLAAKAARLSLLAELSAGLVRGEPPGAAFTGAVARAGGALGVCIAMYHSADEEARVLRLEHQVGLPPEAGRAPGPLPYGSLLCGRVADTRQPVVAEGALGSPDPGTAACKRLGVRAYAGYPLLDAGGRLLGVVAFASTTREAFMPGDLDCLATAARHVASVAGRLRAEAALRESEERFRTLADNAPVMVWVTDPRGRATYVSPSWHAATGQGAGDALGLGWLDAVHPDDRRAVARGFGEAVARQAPFRLEYRLLAASGPDLWAIAVGAPRLDGTGAFQGHVGCVVDITERKAAEEQAARARASAEDADRAKSRFLAAASHDLRQPVQAMALFAGVLEGHVAPGPGRAALDNLNQGLAALKGMLDGLLDVSRLEAGAVSPKPADFPVAGLLGELAAAYGAVAEDKGVRFRVAHPKAMVRSDRVLLARMLRNLLENAVRYTPAGGEVALECEEAGGMLRLAVADTGIGIPAEHLARVFEEFHQVGNRGRNREEGLGLGLAIVRRLSRLLGHPVGVESEPGRGSRFTVTVPCAGPAAGPEPVAGDGPAEALPPGLLALVVDDDAIVLAGLAATLRGLGLDVVAAAGPDEAAAGVEREGRQPDIVLTDYRLRDGRCGTEVVAAARRVAGREVPGVLLTGESGAEAEADAKAMGLLLAHKPATRAHLSKVLAEALSA